MLTAIQEAEKSTSGEIRIFVESSCKYVNPVDRAAELFFELKMHETAQRNATLIYLATADHQAAVFGDEGIHQKVGATYWYAVVEDMLRHFKQQNLAAGVCRAITALGMALKQHFPYNSETDKNELPDEIVFGR